MVDAPLTAAKLVKSAKFKLEEENGDIYSDTEMDMPGYKPPRSFEDEPIPIFAAPVDEEQLEKDKKAKENLLQTHKILVDTEKALGLDLCKKYKESRVEFMINQIAAGQTVCPICSQQLKKTSRLKEHMNQHLVDPKFVCPKCNKCFGERQGYNRHLLAQNHTINTSVIIVTCTLILLDTKISTSLNILRPISVNIAKGHVIP